jgi:hypothetical protein
LEQKYINDGIKDIFDEVTKNTWRFTIYLL